MVKTERDRIPMLRIFKAIKQLRAGHHKATAPRIAKITGRTCNQTSAAMLYLWDWGYIAKRVIKTTKNKHRSAGGCTFEYDITLKGERKYLRLLVEFGDISNQPPDQHQKAQCCLTLPTSTSADAGQIPESA